MAENAIVPGGGIGERLVSGTVRACDVPLCDVAVAFSDPVSSDLCCRAHTLCFLFRSATPHSSRTYGRIILCAVFPCQAYGLVGGSVFAAVKLAWDTTPYDSKQVAYKQMLSSVGRNSAIFASVGAAWSLGNGMAEKMRGVDDAFNSIVGSAAAGGVLGIVLRSGLRGVGAAVAFSAASLLVDFSGGRMDQREPAQLRRLMDLHDPSGASSSE
jgi:hypothetical protein